MIARAAAVTGILALAGLTAGGSVAAQPNPTWIRVAVVQGDLEVFLQIHGQFTMRSLQTGQPVQEGRRLERTPVRAAANGLTLGKELLPVSGLRIEPTRDATITVNGSRLRGTLDIVRQADESLLVINHLALEDYLRGVLSKEAPDYWPEEALKAIAIAARTYAVYQRLTKSQKLFDVSATVMSQDYGGKTAEKHATSLAVEATAGWILTSHGKLFPTFYHSTCGGMTENGRAMGPTYDLPPLRGGIACRFCTASPFYAWRRRLTREDLAWALRKSAHGTVGAVQDLRVLTRTESGRVAQAAIVGSQRTVRLSGYDLRALFGFDRIRSPRFTVVPVEGGFVLDGHGWGHGVGMCQWGAAELAREGVLAPEILTFYYPETELVQLRDLEGRPIELLGGTS